MHADRRAVHQQVPASRLGRPRTDLDRRQRGDLPGLLAVPRVQSRRAAARSQGHGDGPRRTPGPEHGRAHTGERHAIPKRLEESACVGVRADPTPVLDRNCVDRADAAGNRIGFVHVIEHRHFVRNRDARAADADRAAECLEIGGARRRKRQIHGIGARGAKRRVVHRRRHRMRHRTAHDAVHGGRVGQRAEVIVLEQRLRVQLPDFAHSPCVGPGRAEAAGEDARGHAVLSHPDEHETARPAPEAEIEERDAVAQARHRRGDLNHLGASRLHGMDASGEIRRHAIKRMGRQHDPPSPGPGDHIVEARAPFDVDPLRAER